MNKQEGFLWCQTLTSTVRLTVEGCRVRNGGCRIESEEWKVKDQELRLGVKGWGQKFVN